MKRVFAAVAVFVSLLCLAGTASAQSRDPVYSWGKFGSAKQTSPSVLTPTAIGSLPTNVQQIVATNSDTYVLTTDGVVHAFGWNNFGELGDGTASDTSTTTPVMVQFPAGIQIASLAPVMPASTGLAIDTSGNLWGWGADTGGSLCSLGEEDTPIQLPFADVTLAIGAGAHAQYDAGGVLWACGDNTFGELGDGSLTSSTAPVQVIALPSGSITALTSSYGASGALIAGKYYDWGLNDNGQLGIGSTTNQDRPQKVRGLGTVQQVSQGGSDTSNGQTLAILASGTIEGWGSDGYGQLCDSSQANKTSPVVITPPSGTTWPDIDSGGATSYAIDSTGHLWACGANQDGQLGNGKNTPRVKPYESTSLSGVGQVSSTAGNVAATAN
jgi:alpha-tubulin suppressor-like RCC1 family protein